MKKKVFSWLRVGTMAASLLAGCGSTGSSDGDAAAEGSAAAETVSAAADETAEDAAEAQEQDQEDSGSAINLISQDLLGSAPADGADFSEMKIGEIESYVINDGGWCEATHKGIVTAMETLGIPEDNLYVLESIDDTDQASVQAAAEQLIEAGCTLIIGASTGYASFLPEVAAEYPDVTFAQWGNKVDGLIGYEIRSYEGMFLAGYACELMSQDENTQLGYSASYDEFSVRTAINAYALGAKYANADATVKVACANSWYDIDVETQCAQSLIDAGIRYMGMEASSPAIPETCEENGAYVVGYHNDMSELAEDAVLVSFTWNFAPIFQQIMISVNDGTATADDFYYWGGACAALTDFASFVPDDVVAAVEEVKAQIESGEVQVYGGELKDRDGNVLVPEGEVMSDDDIILQEFFVENVDCAW